MKRYVWPDGYTSAYAFTIDVDAESPQMWRERQGSIRGLNELEQRRFGLREGIFNLLEVLERFGCKATCYVPGFEAESRPWLLETIASRGHEVALHGYYHEVPAHLSPAQFREVTEKCLFLFERVLGKKPVGFRSPAWEMTAENLAAVRDLGLLYDSSLSGYDHPYELDNLIELPVQWPLDDAVFLRFSGGGDRWPPRFTADACEGWKDYARSVARYAGLAVSTVHPWITGRPGRIALAETMLEYCMSNSTIWTATMAELAAYHAGSANKGVFSESAPAPSIPEGYVQP